jgi:hypothetical protein
LKKQLRLDTGLANYSQLFWAANIVISIGIILVTSGGSWDVTNHILNKPETFFSPPHSLLYTGVGTAFFGFILLYISWKKSLRPQKFLNGVRIAGIGIALLLGAGPVDFVWHSNFGLDGLLSPPHLVLISGMVLSSVGALLNARLFLQESKTPSRILLIISLLPVWLSFTGILYSFSLPFSDTEFFDFNPNPVFAAFFASVAYPFLISSILIISSILSRYRFGTASIIGALYLAVMTLSAIIPNQSLVPTIPFYWLNIIPIALGDYVVSKMKDKKVLFMAGGIFGSSFFFVYYPLITYTYNEILSHKLIWPSITSQIYFEMIPIIAPILIGSGIMTGILATKFSQKIMTNPKN